MTANDVTKREVMRAFREAGATIVHVSPQNPRRYITGDAVMRAVAAAAIIAD
jgi:hypothetical protein